MRFKVFILQLNIVFLKRENRNSRSNENGTIAEDEEELIVDDYLSDNEDATVKKLDDFLKKVK